MRKLCNLEVLSVSGGELTEANQKHLLIMSSGAVGKALSRGITLLFPSLRTCSPAIQYLIEDVVVPGATIVGTYLGFELSNYLYGTDKTKSEVSH